MEKLRYRLAKLLVRAANMITPPAPSDGFQWIDNIDYLSREYLETFNPDMPLKQIWEGWEQVTEENAQAVIDDLRRAAILEQTRKEQDSLNE